MFGLKIVSKESFKQLVETVTLYSRQLEDIGWINISLQDNTQAQIIGEGFKKMLRTCKVYYYKNPLAGHWVHLTTEFVFGEGVSKPKAKEESPKTQEVIDKFWNDPDNKKAFTSFQAQQLLSNKLQYEGNLFFVLFDDDEGDVRVRVLNTEEIEDVIRDPDDRMRTIFYKAANKERKYNFLSDAYEISLTKYIYYADSENHNPEDYKIPADKLTKSAVVYHVKINCDINDKFGIPELYRGIDWIKAHKDSAGDLATLVKSLSTLAWKKKVKGTATQVTSLQAAARAKTDLTNPAKIAGSTQYENEAIDTSPIATPTGGAVIGEKVLKQMQLMVCAASGIFYHYFGDPETGNLATTTSMELPMIKKFVAYQKLWETIYTDVITYVIHKKIEVGIFPGTYKYDDKTMRNVYEPNEDITLDVDFPPIIEKDLKVVAEALQIGKDSNLISDETAAKIFLLAAGQNNVEDEIGKIDFARVKPVTSPWGFAGGQPMPGDQPGKKQPSEKQPPEKKPAPIKEAIGGQKNPAARMTKKNNYLAQRMNGYRKALMGHFGQLQKDIRENLKAAGIPGKIVGNIENLSDHLDKFRKGMAAVAESYFPVAIEIGSKYLQSHLKESCVRESIFEANSGSRDLLRAKLDWNGQYLASSLIPDMESKITEAMRSAYKSEVEFRAAINSAVGTFEARVEQYAGAFWSVEEAAVKEAGKGTGAMVNFVGADDGSTCDGCAEAMDGNPYLIDEAPEPGSHQCDGRCFIDPRTVVITDKGWRRIDSIKVGDKVLGHSGKLRRINEVINIPAEKEEVTFEIAVTSNLKKWFGWALDKNKERRKVHKFLVTDDHEFLVEGKWIKSRNIISGQRIAIMAKVCKQCGELFSVTKEGLYSEVCSNDCSTKYYRKYDPMHTKKVWGKCALATKKRMQNPLERKNLSDKIKIIMNDEKRKDINRKSLNKRWQNKEDAKIMLCALERGRANCRNRSIPTSIEVAMGHLLDKLHIQYIREFRIGGYFCDFYIPDFRIVIEVDGAYWHSGKLSKERDVERDKYMENLGYTVIRFEELEINKNIDLIEKSLVTTFANHQKDYKLTQGIIVSIKQLKTRPDRLYCLRVDRDESFVVNRGIISHNCRHALQILDSETGG